MRLLERAYFSGLHSFYEIRRAEQNVKGADPRYVWNKNQRLTYACYCTRIYPHLTRSISYSLDVPGWVQPVAFENPVVKTYDR